VKAADSSGHLRRIIRGRALDWLFFQYKIVFEGIPKVYK
jgi:hypothetical protein